MKKFLIIGIAIVIIVIAGVLYYSGVGSAGYWETEAEFGAWQDELVLEFADGSTKSLKIINEKPLAYYVGDQEVTKVWIQLKAATSGSGYDTVEIDCQSFGYQCMAYSEYGETVFTGPHATKGTDYEIYLGNSQIIYNKNDAYYSFNTILGSDPDGDYEIEYKVEGTVKYRGMPGGSWATATNPPDRTLWVTKDTNQGGQIVFTLTSGTGGS